MFQTEFDNKVLRQASPLPVANFQKSADATKSQSTKYFKIFCSASKRLSAGVKDSCPYFSSVASFSTFATVKKNI